MNAHAALLKKLHQAKCKKNRNATLSQKRLRKVAYKEKAEKQYESEVLQEQPSIVKELTSIGSIKDEILENIVGQDEPVQRILTAVYRALNFETIKTNMLIIGRSGTGKTETIKQIAQRLDLPYTIEDATRYTQEGYYGKSVDDIITNLISAANGDFDKAERGIIVIDEIDKKVGGTQNDISGINVLHSMLKLIEDATYNIMLPAQSMDDLTCPQFRQFSTKNIIVIFSGAFSGINEIVEKRLNEHTVGFVPEADCSAKSEESRKITKSDLIEYGMPEEFAGRIDTIVQMNQLREEDLVQILMQSKLSIFKKYQSELENHGVQLIYKRELFDKIARASLKFDTGARELSNIVNYIFEKIVYEVLMKPDSYKYCKLDDDIVEDNTRFTLY